MLRPAIRFRSRRTPGTIDLCMVSACTSGKLPPLKTIRALLSHTEREYRQADLAEDISEMLLQESTHG